ncbi:MAG: hypothetical protein WEG56_12500 [Chloroflexota bacterium]
MQVAMCRIDIVAPRSAAAHVVRIIHRAGIVHLIPYEPVGSPGSSVFVAESRALRGDADRPSPMDAALDRITASSGLLSTPDASDALVREWWEASDQALLEQVVALEPAARRASELTAGLQSLRAEAARLAGYRRIVEGLRWAVGHVPSIRGYASTGIVVRARYREVIGLVREELDSLTDGRSEVISADIDADRVAAVLIYPVRLAPDVRALLGGRDLEEVSLPESLVAVPFDELMPRLEAEESTLHERAGAAEAELGRLAATHGALVASLRLVLADRQAEGRVIAAAGRSDHLTVISGWLPRDSVEDLRARLETEVGPDVLVIERAADPTSRSAPVALENRPVLRAFEPLASFVSLPRYGTVDPTPLIAFALPIFVGLMVGDVGYGLVLLAILALARRRWREARAMAFIWPVGALAALSTILFGFLFGEAFGDVGHEWLGLEPLWFDRRHEVLPLLVLAFAIGVAQIGLGLVLGVVNATRLHHRREAIGRIALLASLVAAIVALAALAGGLPAWAGPLAVVVLVAALVLLSATLGLAGPIEMMGVFGNVLSYARLMAVGLASVMLALIANRMGGVVENALVGFAIAAVFHALAIVLGFFDSSVQGIRLQYVEFFSKFVEPGGVRYEPFVSVLGREHGSRAPLAGGA